MESVNEVTLIGNVGKIETRYTQGGDPVVSLSLATSSNWKDSATQEQKERVEWHNVVLFGQHAKYSSKFIKKGFTLYIRGESQTRSYPDPHGGKDRYINEVILNKYEHSVKIMKGENREQQNQGQQQAYNAPQNNGQQQAYNAPQNQGQRPQQVPQNQGQRPQPAYNQPQQPPQPTKHR